MSALTSARLAKMERYVCDPQVQVSQNLIEEKVATPIDVEAQYNGVFRPDMKSRVEKGIAFVHQHQTRRRYIRMHGHSLREVLAILYSNALKYAPRNTEVRATIKEYEWSFEYTVSNLGMPLLEGERFRIFRREYRGTNAQGKEGSGLGLYIAREICKLYRIVLDYKWRKAGEAGEASDNPVWHDFYMSIPRELCTR